MPRSDVRPGDVVQIWPRQAPAGLMGAICTVRRVGPKWLTVSCRGRQHHLPLGTPLRVVPPAKAGEA